VTQQESESSGQSWGNARGGCPLLFCRQARELARAVPGTAAWQETAPSPAVTDLWTLENLQRPSAHLNRSPAPLSQPFPSLHPTEPFPRWRADASRACSARVRARRCRGGWPRLPRMQGSRWHGCLHPCKEELKVPEVSVTAAPVF